MRFVMLLSELLVICLFSTFANNSSFEIYITLCKKKLSACVYVVNYKYMLCVCIAFL